MSTTGGWDLHRRYRDGHIEVTRYVRFADAERDIVSPSAYLEWSEVVALIGPDGREFPVEELLPAPIDWSKMRAVASAPTPSARLSRSVNQAMERSEIVTVLVYVGYCVAAVVGIGVAFAVLRAVT